MKIRFWTTQLIATLFAVLLTTTNVLAQASGSPVLQRIAKAETLKVGMTSEQPPFNVTSRDGRIIGMDVDLAGLLATSMGVKLEIVEMMNLLEGNELGLVLFAGDSFIQFPLTFDFATARSFLDNARPGIISRPGTDIGDAIETAIRGFNEKRASQKVIIIMTDGENHEPGAIEAAQEAAEAGIIIYTIGFGSPGGEPIPRYNDQDILIGFKKGENGQTILSRLDEVTLQEVALATNGQYFRSTAGGQEIDVLISELETLETTEFESRFETTRVERFQSFLAVALLGLIVIELIPDRIKERVSDFVVTAEEKA